MAVSSRSKKAVCGWIGLKYGNSNNADFEILEGFFSKLLLQDIKIKNILESEGNKQTDDNLKYFNCNALHDIKKQYESKVQHER